MYQGIVQCYPSQNFPMIFRGLPYTSIVLQCTLPYPTITLLLQLQVKLYLFHQCGLVHPAFGPISYPLVNRWIKCAVHLQNIVPSLYSTWLFFILSWQLDTICPSLPVGLVFSCRNCITTSNYYVKGCNLHSTTGATRVRDMRHWWVLNSQLTKQQQQQHTCTTTTKSQILKK